MQLQNPNKLYMLPRTTATTWIFMCLRCLMIQIQIYPRCQACHKIMYLKGHTIPALKVICFQLLIFLILLFFWGGGSIILHVTIGREISYVFYDPICHGW